MIKTFRLFENKKRTTLIIGSYYSFKSYTNNTKFLMKLIDIKGNLYLFDKIEDLKYPPFRFFRGDELIDKYTIDNWISDREFKEEKFFRTSEDPELWLNTQKYNI